MSLVGVGMTGEVSMPHLNYFLSMSGLVFPRRMALGLLLLVTLDAEDLNAHNASLGIIGVSCVLYSISLCFRIGLSSILSIFVALSLRLNLGG